MKVVSSYILWVLLGVMIAIAVYQTHEQGYRHFNHPEKAYPIKGIDVSHHQGKINWDVLANEKLSFAFIKATEGGDHKDKRFQENWENAIRHGLATGAYHFFTFCKTGEEQASNFIETVPLHDSALPPTIDLEFGGNCKRRISKEDLLKELHTFIRLVSEKYKQKPVIYATNTSYRVFLSEVELPNTSIWIRDIYKKPQLPDQRPWVFWQYFNRGQLTGINGPVDLNVFNGDAKAFEHYRQQAKLTIENQH